MGAFSGKSRPTGIVILVDRQKCWFVADICDVIVVEVVETVYEGGRAAKRGDQGRLIVGNKASASVRQSLSHYRIRTYKEYSQIELSKVSAPVFCKEQTLFGSVSMLLHFKGSCDPKVLFKYRG